MGYGLPAAVGAKRLYPERTVVCVAGDGDFLMNGQEFATAVQYDLPIIVLIMDNGMYGTIRAHQEREFPGRIIATVLRNPDFAAYARAFGGFGATVEKTEHFADAFKAAQASGKPAILHLKVDPQAISPATTLDAIRAKVDGGAKTLSTLAMNLHLELNAGSLLQRSESRMAYRRTENVVRRLAARHDAILAAAGALAAEAGINAVQIAPVAERAGIAAGTVYRYFPSKTELVAALVASVSERELGAMRRAADAAPGPLSALAAAITTFAARALREPQARLCADRRAGRCRRRRGAARIIARRSPPNSARRLAAAMKARSCCPSRTSRSRRRRCSAPSSKGWSVRSPPARDERRCATRCRRSRCAPSASRMRARGLVVQALPRARAERSSRRRHARGAIGMVAHRIASRIEQRDREWRSSARTDRTVPIACKLGHRRRPAA